MRNVGSIAYEIHEGTSRIPNSDIWEGFRPVASFLTEEGARYQAKRHYKNVAYRIVETKILSEYIPAREKTT